MLCCPYSDIESVRRIFQKTKFLKTKNSLKIGKMKTLILVSQEQ